MQSQLPAGACMGAAQFGSVMQYCVIRHGSCSIGLASTSSEGECRCVVSSSPCHPQQWEMQCCEVAWQQFGFSHVPGMPMESQMSMYIAVTSRWIQQSSNLVCAHHVKRWLVCYEVQPCTWGACGMHAEPWWECVFVEVLW